MNIFNFKKSMKTIEDFKTLPRKRQVSIGMSVAILILLIAISIGASFVQAAYLDATSSEQSDDESAPSPDTLDQAVRGGGYEALSTSQKVLADAYGDNERKFVEFLQASVWMADKEAKRLEFSDYAFREFEGSSDKAKEIPFVIAAVTKTKDEASGAVIERTNAAIQTSATSKMLELQAVTDKDGNTTYSLTSEAFKGAKTYVRGQAAGEFKLEGIDGEFAAILGGEQEALESKLKEYCAVSFPTATSAAWDKRAVSDYNSNTVTFSVVLNNEKKSQVNITYSMQDKTFAINAIR